MRQARRPATSSGASTATTIAARDRLQPRSDPGADPASPPGPTGPPGASGVAVAAGPALPVVGPGTTVGGGGIPGWLGMRVSCGGGVIGGSPGRRGQPGSPRRPGSPRPPGPCRPGSGVPCGGSAVGRGVPPGPGRPGSRGPRGSSVARGVPPGPGHVPPRGVALGFGSRPPPGRRPGSPVARGVAFGSGVAFPRSRLRPGISVARGVDPARRAVAVGGAPDAVGSGVAVTSSALPGADGVPAASLPRPVPFWRSSSLSALSSSLPAPGAPPGSEAVGGTIVGVAVHSGTGLAAGVRVGAGAAVGVASSGSIHSTWCTCVMAWRIARATAVAGASPANAAVPPTARTDSAMSAAVPPSARRITGCDRSRRGPRTRGAMAAQSAARPGRGRAAYARRASTTSACSARRRATAAAQSGHAAMCARAASASAASSVSSAAARRSASVRWVFMARLRPSPRSPLARRSPPGLRCRPRPPQRRRGGVDAGLGRAQRHPQHLAQLGEAQLLDLAQEQRLALQVREVAERPRDPPVGVHVLDVRGRRRRLLDVTALEPAEQPVLQPPAPQSVAAAVDGDGMQPRRECPALRVVALEVAQGLHHHVLHHVLGLVVVAQNAVRQPEHGLPVPLVQLPQRGLVTRSGSLDQVIDQAEWSPSRSRSHPASSSIRLMRG